MTAAEFVSSTRNRFERLFDALTDPSRCERAMLLVLAGYLATWSLYATIAKSSQDIHTDMGEMVAWAHDAGLGTPKHPPLAAWLVGAWFEVLPRQDWAYYVFAILLATVALWIAWRLSARYLPPDKRVAGIALLTLVPFYNFHAVKFNANTVLTPLWALTTWWFLRSFETRRVGWAALTGIAAAAAMLGKYWSVTLLAGLGLAALSDPRRDTYFNSPAPYVTLAVGTILLTPHIDWLITHQFLPFSYAVEAHPATFVTAAISALYFIGAGLCYIAAPVILTLLAARPEATAIGDTLWPSDPERRTLVIAFAAPSAFAVVIAVLLTVKVESLWAVSMMTLLPVVLLSSPQLTLPRRAAVGLVALAVIFPVLMLATAPLSAIYDHRHGVPNFASDYRLVARAVERAWRARTDRPLRIVGSTNFVNGIVFYFADLPSSFDVDDPTLTPWASDRRIRRKGLALVCPEAEPFCMRKLPGYAAHYHAVAVEHVEVSRRYLGIAGKPQRYEIVIILPQQS
jgi:Dolichyl-phosphate-mannose-protein mannosyltransferase